MENKQSKFNLLRREFLAERVTRQAILDAARAGAEAVVLEAIASDPIAVEAIGDDGRSSVG